MKLFMLGPGVVAAMILAMAPLTAAAGENCTCRYSGGEVAEGMTACIKTPNGMALARCERVLNNTSWKMLDQACPFAESSPSGERVTLARVTPVEAGENPSSKTSEVVVPSIF